MLTIMCSTWGPVHHLTSTDCLGLCIQHQGTGGPIHPLTTCLVALPQSATVTPAEAAFVGRLRNLVVEWQSYRTLIEQLCDPAMKQHHMNLLLLEMGLVSELPKPAAKSRAQSGTKNTGGSKNAPLSGISFRERMGMTDDRIAYEKESPSLQQRVTFMQVLKKAYATQVDAEILLLSGAALACLLPHLQGRLAGGEGNREGDVDHGVPGAASFFQY